MMTEANVMELARDMMSELKDINQKLAYLNTNIALIGEKQNVAGNAHEELRARVAVLENSHINCPARNAYKGAGMVVSHITSGLALVCAAIAIYQSFRG